MLISTSVGELEKELLKNLQRAYFGATVGICLGPWPDVVNLMCVQWCQEYGQRRPAGLLWDSRRAGRNDAKPGHRLHQETDDQGTLLAGRLELKHRGLCDSSSSSNRLNLMPFTEHHSSQAWEGESILACWGPDFWLGPIIACSFIFSPFPSSGTRLSVLSV